LDVWDLERYQTAEGHSTSLGIIRLATHDFLLVVR